MDPSGSPLFGNDVVMLASSGGGHQLALESFTVRCEALRMKIITIAVYFYSCCDADTAPVCCSKESAEHKGEALDLHVDLRPDPHIWSQATILLLKDQDH